jgi:opacity protein-like surface antigen
VGRDDGCDEEPMMKSMKKFLCVCAALAMALSAASAMAADVTGRWTADVKAPDGSSFPLTFTFKQDGNTLTGTVLGAGGDPIPITNGKVDGDKFTFDDSFNGITIHHDCTLDGDTIKITTKTDSADFPGMELTLTRTTDAPGKPTVPAAPAQPAAPPQ